MLRDFLVQQTLVLTRDHLLISPYCTAQLTLTRNLTEEVCLWSLLGCKGLNVL